MKTRAAVLYGKKDIRIREFELPDITKDELLVKVISNSICLSTYKAALLGEDHKRVPKNIASHPVITGHEFAGIIVEVGANLKNKFKEGDKFVLQPAMGLKNGYSAGYSYEYFGGNATYTIIPKVAIDLGCVLPYKGDYFANGSLAEPMSCIIGAYNANYHTTPYVYKHQMGIKEGGNLALLGSAGPMGIGAVDYAINGKKKPRLVVVTDINDKRLKRVQQLIPEEDAKKKGIKLVYFNTAKQDSTKSLSEFTDNNGYDDVFVFAPIPTLIEQADDILGNDGCLNFFSGPTDKNLKVPFNFYNVHYLSTHVVGTSGGSTEDMKEALNLSFQNKINPSYMITHIGGLNAAPNTILNLNTIPGGKKLIYTHIEMELTAISDFERLGKTNGLFRELDRIVKKNNGLWCKEAESYLLNYYKVI
ncbi:MAG TPA: L-sorbose 1-phosphate reductase [Clostridiaceae bacterium]|nr:L-sorbose 1-phosphate reductase [Clostridiaceae bacterium]